MNFKDFTREFVTARRHICIRQHSSRNIFKLHLIEPSHEAQKKQRACLGKDETPKTGGAVYQEKATWQVAPHGAETGALEHRRGLSPDAGRARP